MVLTDPKDYSNTLMVVWTCIGGLEVEVIAFSISRDVPFRFVGSSIPTEVFLFQLRFAIYIPILCLSTISGDLSIQFNIVLFALHSDWYKKTIKILRVSTEIG